MDWRIVLEIITLLAGAGGTTAFFTLKARTRKERASADKAEAEVMHTQRGSDKDLLDWAEDKVMAIDEAYKEMNRKYIFLERTVTTLISLLQRNDIYYCKRIDCAIRDPALGTHKTVLPTIKHDDLNE